MTLVERMKRRIKIFGADSLSSDERDMLAALEAADAMVEAYEGDTDASEVATALAAYRAATRGEG